jgi:hypothetical protein
MPRFTHPLAYENILSPASGDYFRRTREARFGRKLEELAPAGEERVEAWKQIKNHDGFDIVDGWLQKNEGSYALGEQVFFVDFFIRRISYLEQNRLGRGQ